MASTGPKTPTPGTEVSTPKPASEPQLNKLKSIADGFQKLGKEPPEAIRKAIGDLEADLAAPERHLTTKEISPIISQGLEDLKAAETAATRGESVEAATESGALDAAADKGAPALDSEDQEALAAVGAALVMAEIEQEEVQDTEVQTTAEVQATTEAHDTSANTNTSAPEAAAPVTDVQISLDSVVYANINRIRDLYAVNKGLDSREETYREEHKEPLRAFIKEVVAAAQALKQEDFGNPEVDRVVKDLRVSLDRTLDATRQAARNVAKFEPEATTQRTQAVMFGASAAAMAINSFNSFKAQPIDDQTKAVGDAIIGYYRNRAELMTKSKAQESALRNVAFVQKAFDHCLATGDAEGAQAIISVFRVHKVQRPIYSPHAKVLPLGQFLSMMGSAHRNPAKTPEDLGKALAVRLTEPVITDPEKQKISWERARQAANLAYLFYTPKDKDQDRPRGRGPTGPAPSAEQLAAAHTALDKLNEALKAKNDSFFIKLTPKLQHRLQQAVGENAPGLTEVKLQKGFVADLAYACRYKELGTPGLAPDLKEKITRGYNAMTTRAASAERLIDLHKSGLLA